MKPSHLKTPRTINEGYWTPGYHRCPWESEPTRPMDWQDKLVVAASVIVCFAVGVILSLA